MYFDVLPSFVQHFCSHIQKPHPLNKELSRKKYNWLLTLHIEISVFPHNNEQKGVKKLNVVIILAFFNILLTMHLSITLVNDQLDAQLLYRIICLLQYSTCFEQCRAHHQEVKLY